MANINMLLYTVPGAPCRSTWFCLEAAAAAEQLQAAVLLQGFTLWAEIAFIQ
jgi:hypothetical protein